MSTVVELTTPFFRKAHSKKLRLLQLNHLPTSQLPYRVVKERTGVTLGSFATSLEMEKFISAYPIEQLQVVPTRKRARA